MLEINFKKVEKNDGDFYKLAKVLGYKDKITEKTETEMLVSEANKQGLYIKEVLEDTTKCIAITETKEIDNPESVVDFLTKELQKLVNNFVKQKMLEVKKQELEREMQKKIKEAEKEIEEKL